MRNFLFFCLIPLLMAANPDSSGCGRTESRSSSGVAKATATVVTGSDGLTAEQRNIKRRIELENKPGAVQHLYLIAADSGQTIFYSTVNGKVSSSGKRLTPKNLDTDGVITPVVRTPDGEWHTTELISDDGAYGDSAEYIYWFDVQGRYHQHFISGNQIVHVSDQPIQVKSVIMTFDGLEGPAAPEATPAAPAAP